MRSKIMSHDEDKRQEFKDRTLRRVYDALNNSKTVANHVSSTEIIVKGLKPKKGKEGS